MPDYPRQTLLFIVSQPDLGHDMYELTQQFIREVADLREWLLGPPRLVHEREPMQGLGPKDQPLELIGGCLEIYSALPPLSLPVDID